MLKTFASLLCGYSLHIVAGFFLGNMQYLDPVSSLRVGASVAIFISGALLVHSFCTSGDTETQRRTRVRTRGMLLETSSILFVYGLGIFLYIFAYASTAASLTSFTGYAIGLSVLVVEDIMVEAQSMSTEVFAASALTLVLGETAVFLILISSEWALYDIQQTTTQTPHGFIVAALVVATPIVMLPLVTFKVREYASRHKAYSVLELLRLAAPFATVLSVCLLFTFPAPHATESQYDDSPPQVQEVYPPPPTLEPTLGVASGTQAESETYAGFDYHNQPDPHKKDANYTPYLPLYVERAANNSMLETFTVLAVLTITTCVTVPTAHKTLSLILSYNTIDVIVCSVLAMSLKHILITGDTLANRFAVGISVTALFIRVATLRVSKKKEGHTAEQGTLYTYHQESECNDIEVDLEEYSPNPH
jgi:hypothetical protein